MGFLITHTGGGSLTYKDAVRTASSANVPLTGSAPIIVGGVSLSDKDRVLLKDQGDATQNGIYTIAISGGAYTLTRSPDCNTSKEMVPNMLVPVSEGTFADRYFQLTTNAPIVLGTTALAFDFASVVDHGTLLGLGDDDHTQYLNTTRAKTWFDTDYLKQTVTNGNTATVPSEDAVFDHVTSATSNLANRSLSNLTSPTALNQVLLGQDGTAAAPAYSFTSDSDVGIYRSAANTLGIAATAGVLIPNTPSTTAKLTIGTLGSGGGGTLEIPAGSWDHAKIIMAGNTIAYSNAVGAFTLANNLFKFGNQGQINFPANHIWVGNQNSGSDGTHFGKNFVLSGATEFFYWGRYNLHAHRRLSVGAPSTNTEILGGTFAARGETNANIGLSFTGPTSTLSITGSAQHQLFFANVGVGDYVYLNGLSGTKAQVVSVTWNTSTYYTGTSTVTLSNAIGDATSRQLFVEKPIIQLRNSSGTIVQELRNDDTLLINSGLNIKSRHAQTGTVTALTSDIYIGCDSNGGTVTVNLPAASSAGAGKKLIIKDEGGFATVNNISIVGSGGDLIDGSAGQSLLVNYESITLVCDGVSGWFII